MRKRVGVSPPIMPATFTVVAVKTPSFTAPSTRTLSPTWISASVTGSRRLRKFRVFVGHNGVRGVVQHAGERDLRAVDGRHLALQPGLAEVGLHLAHLFDASRGRSARRPVRLTVFAAASTSPMAPITSPTLISVALICCGGLPEAACPLRRHGRCPPPPCPAPPPGACAPATCLRMRVSALKWTVYTSPGVGLDGVVVGSNFGNGAHHAAAHHSHAASAAAAALAVAAPSGREFCPGGEAEPESCATAAAANPTATASTKRSRCFIKNSRANRSAQRPTPCRIDARAHKKDDASGLKRA